MKRVVLLISLLAVLALTANAGSLALDIIPNPGNVGNNGIGYSLGWSFQVNSPITVTSLAFFDNLGNGLAEAHDVGIWDSAGNLLVSGTVLPTDALVGLAPWREHAVRPTVLTPGVYYIAGVSGSIDVYAFDPTAILTIPSIKYLQDQWVQSNVLAFPSSSSNNASGFSWFGPSFDVVPEAATFALLLIGIGITAVMRRRKA